LEGIAFPKVNDTPEPLGLAGRARIGSSTVCLAIFLLFLFLTLVLSREIPVVDVTTRQAVEGAWLEPIRPAIQGFTEPVFGPLHAFSALPFWRMLAVLLWLAGGIFTYRVVRSFRARRGLRGLAAEVGLLIGAYAPLAAFPVVLYWTEFITKRTMVYLTPAGLPLVAFVLTLGVVLFRKTSRGRRLRLIWIVTRSFLGIAGGIAFGCTVVFYFAPHLVYQTGERLAAVPGKVTLDLHAHGMEGDGPILGPERLDIFHHHGLQLTAVTEHNNFDRDADDKPFQTICQLIRTRGLNMAALPGQEFTTHVSHLLILGSRKTYLPRDYRCDDYDQCKLIGPDYGYDWSRLLRDVHGEGAYAVVAHWWMPWTYYRVDWRRLVGFGVDGFEVSSGADWAPRGLMEAWKASGQRLFAGTDFHGWHKSIYTWNLIDERVINPEGKPLAELDPWVLVRRIFESRATIPVAAATFVDDLPEAFEPPIAFLRYFIQMRLPGRLMWAVAAVAFWGWGRLRKTRQRSVPEALAPVDVPPPGRQARPARARAPATRPPVPSEEAPTAPLASIRAVPPEAGRDS
jgi:hypothetical protein